MNITFSKLKADQLEMVLRWRTSEKVTKYMYSDIEYNMDNQLKWFRGVSGSNTDKYWVISIKEVPVGLISLNQIDYTNRKTSWGYYIGNEDYRLYGGLIPPYLYNYVFSELGLNKITAEVMEGNEGVRKLHLMHGYREVGICSQHVFKNGNYHSVYIMELLKERWENGARVYRKYTGRFEE